MIYVLLGIIGLLVIILVAMGVALWQDKDYVYTGEYLNEIIKDYDEAVKDRNEVITSLQGKLKDKNQVFNTSYDFLNQLIDEERKTNFVLSEKNELYKSNNSFLETRNDYLEKRLENTFKFESKYNVGDKIAYSVNGKVKFGNVKNIIVEVAKSDEKIYQYELYLYLTKEGDRVYEEQIISKQ